MSHFAESLASIEAALKGYPDPAPTSPDWWPDRIRLHRELVLAYSDLMASLFDTQDNVLIPSEILLQITADATQHRREAEGNAIELYDREKKIET